MDTTEQHLIKLLEYDKMPAHNAYRMMAQALGLDFYSDGEGTSLICTICSSMFVLDIAENSCNLIFVDESHSTNLSHIPKYFNAYLHKRLVFFHLLKFFVRLVDLEPNLPPILPGPCSSSSDLSRYKNVCACIFTQKYCLSTKFNTIPANYNIFTHRVEQTLFDPLISISTDQQIDKGSAAGPIFSPNLYTYFTPEDLDMHVIQAWSDKGLCEYDGGGIRVHQFNIYINGIKCPFASFAFKKGCTLGEALEISAKLNK